MNPSTEARPGEDEIADAKLHLRRSTKNRRLLIVIALLVAWSLVATGTLVWVATTSAMQTRVQLWNAESTLLDGIGPNLGRASYDIGLFVASNNLTLGQAVWSDFLGASLVARQSTLQPAYAIAVTLNLTWNFLNCASDGYYALMISAVGDPSARNLTQPILRQVGNLTGSVSLLMNVAPVGTDPLDQLGPSAVREIQANMAELYALMASPGHCRIPPLTPPVVTAST